MNEKKVLAILSSKVLALQHYIKFIQNMLEINRIILPLRLCVQFHIEEMQNQKQCSTVSAHYTQHDS